MGEELLHNLPEKSEEEEKTKEHPSNPPQDAKKENPNSKESKENAEIILQVYMHCQGCATKVRRSLKGFQGVEGVVTDCRTSRVVVKGEKADPAKVLERIQMKTHRQVDLISPIPKPPSQEEVQKPIPKLEDKKEEQPQLPLITVVLRVHMHCEACSQEIERRTLKMKGVESAVADLKTSQVTVSGAFQAEKLTDYVYRRTGKHATIVKVEGEKKEQEEEEKKGGKEEEKTEIKVEEKGSKKEEMVGEKMGEGKVEMKGEESSSNMYYNYYSNNNNNNNNNNNPVGVGIAIPMGGGYAQVQEYYGGMVMSQQMFSDENPNACAVM